MREGECTFGMNKTSLLILNNIKHDSFNATNSFHMIEVLRDLFHFLQVYKKQSNREHLTGKA